MEPITQERLSAVASVAAISRARGKKAYDKRASIKERDWQREKERLLRDKD